RAIRLEHVTAIEVARLARQLNGGGGNADETLRSVLYWTGGHPYLTQKLPRTLSECGSALDDSAVDEACWRLFLEARDRDIDSSLLFVRDTLLHSGKALESCLELYARVLRGERVQNAESDSACALLRLSGIVKIADGRLHPRD